MSLFKKPSELKPKSAISVLIYGQPGTGKSTLACSAPDPVLFDYDGGVNRINGAHQVPTLQVESWEQTQTALDEVRRDPEIKSIIIDTAGKMLAFMDEFITRTMPKHKKADGSLSLQGYGVRKAMFIKFIHDATIMGKNIIFVAHEIEQKRGDETVIRPEVGGSSSNDLIKELDLVGYMEMIGQKRTISFDPCEKFYAKNTCNMPGRIELPILTDPNGNAVGENSFLVSVLNSYQKRQVENRENTTKYEALCDLIDENVAAVADATSANDFVKWCAGIEHIFNSKAKAKTAISRKAKALGLKFDSINKVYVYAE